jgi:hypothetical protein
MGQWRPRHPFFGWLQMLRHDRQEVAGLNRLDTMLTEEDDVDLPAPRNNVGVPLKLVNVNVIALG